MLVVGVTTDAVEIANYKLTLAETITTLNVAFISFVPIIEKAESCSDISQLLRSCKLILNLQHNEC